MLNRLRYCSLISLLLLSACTSTTNVSRVYPFSLYVGKTVEINRPMAVVPAYNRWVAGNGGVGTLSWTVSKGLENTNDVKGARYAVLPTGHQVRIDKVQDEIVGDSESIVAYGRTVIPPDTKPVKFAYAWGYLWILEPAPWEPENLPKYRHLPSRYRLPAHFDYDMFQSPTNVPTWDAVPTPRTN
jgi:hypothetical protein